MNEELRRMSLDELEELALNDDAEAAMEIADRYRTGRGVEMNVGLSNEWAARAANQDKQNASSYEAGAEGQKYSDSEDAPGDEYGAYSETRQNDQGKPPVTERPDGDTFEAQTAHWQQNHYEDYSFVTLKKLAAEGDPYACIRFAARYDHDGASDNELQDAAEYYERAVRELENHCSEVGIIKILVQTLQQMVTFYGKYNQPEKRFGCLVNMYELDHACVRELARCYANGEGCTKDLGKAMPLLEQEALDKKTCEAYLDLAQVCREQGHPTDALDWCQAALTAYDVDRQPVLRDATVFLQMDIRQEDGPTGKSVQEAYKKLMDYESTMGSLPVIVKEIIEKSEFTKALQEQTHRDAEEEQTRQDEVGLDAFWADTQKRLRIEVAVQVAILVGVAAATLYSIDSLFGMLN